MNNPNADNVGSRPHLPPNAPCAQLTATTAEGAPSCRTDRPVILIGSRRDCSLPIPNPDISKIHCAVINTGAEIVVRDLLSRSGTFVNGKAVRTAALRPGDKLRVGPAEIELTFVTPGPNQKPTDAQASLELARPLRLELADRQVEIRETAAVIGRREGAEVPFDSPDVSLAHALLFVVGNRPAVCDLGSRSGTFLNGQRTDLAWLSSGNELGIGGEKLAVHFDDPPPVAAETATVAAAAPAAPTPAPAPADQKVRSAEARPIDPASGPADLSELEQTIAAVQTQISGARQRLDERQRELEQREIDFNQRVAESARAQANLEQTRAQLDARSAELDEQRKRVEAERGALAAERAKIDEARAGLTQQQQALSEAGQAAQRKQDELRQREEQLAQTTAQLTQQQQQLDAQRAELDQRLASHAQEFAELEQRGEALASQEAALGERNAALAARESALGERDAALTAQVATLAERDAALAAQQSALGERDAALTSQETALGERDSALAAREQELASREASLRDSETRHGAALARIEQFRSMLNHASSLFASSTGSAPAAGGTNGTPPAPASGAAPASPESAPNAAGAAAGAAQATSEPAGAGCAPAEAGELPAPMVDRPIFAADPAVPPQDWPSELRERFRVLRRVSTKSNEDLLAQVWAERDRVQARAGDNGTPKPRKRRFPWGS